VQNQLRVVGIGASAGGLRALEAFFHAVEDNLGFSYVVIQHLSPDFKSLMGELLARHTKMTISSVHDDERICPNHVYLIPPRKVLRIADERLRLEESTGTPSLPVDVFFKSLADQFGEKSYGIILSGTGSDGSKGCGAIKSAGGSVFVQDPQTAEFDGMPRSVILSGAYDHILSPNQMPKALADPTFKLSQGVQDASSSRDGIGQIADSLRQSYGLDIENYKDSTVFRRIQRRIEKTSSPSIAHYSQMLSEKPEELDELYRDLLIGVTSFFRDEHLWLTLAKNTIPSLFERAGSIEFRAWVAGCATGEEVYTLAMLLAEEAEYSGYKGEISIFATDLHQGSLAAASEGVYTSEALEPIPEDLREKYFFKQNGTHRVSSSLRSKVVFASHNLLADPPFTRLDLATCRNLLIYLEPQAQERAISMLLYGLREGGCLALGASENPNSARFGLDTLDTQARIFQKIKSVPVIGLPSSLTTHATRSLPKKWKASKGVSISPQLLSDYDAIISSKVGDGFIIDEQQKVLHYVGDPNLYLKPASGRASNSLFDLLSGDLHLALSTCLQRVKSKETHFTMRGIRNKDDESGTLVDLRVDPLPSKEQEAHFFVSICKTTKRLAAKAFNSRENIDIDTTETYDSTEASSRRIAELELELQASRENMQAAIEQAQTSNEELQAANEELLASNEELQSTNEELHSVNEELFSVNSEFELKNYELQNLNEDHDHLLSSLVNIGIVYLDENLRVRKYNEAVTSIFKLRPEDVGRPLGDIAYTLGNHKKFIRRVGKVLESEKPISFETRTQEDKWLMVRIFPFNRDGEITSGVILTFTDISEIKQAQNRLELAVTVSHLVWWDWDLERDRLVTYSAHERSYDCILGYDQVSIPKTFKGWLDATHPDDAEAVRKNLQDHLDGKTQRWVSEHRYKAQDGSWVWVRDLGEAIVRDSGGKPLKMVGTTQNIHDQKLLELSLREKCKENELLLKQAEETADEMKRLAQRADEANKAKSEFLAMMSHEIRTPLNAIIGYSELLLSSGLEEQAQDNLRPIKVAGSNLLAIIGDILDFSKLEANSIELESRPFCLQDLAEQAVSTVPPKTGVKCSMEIIPREPESAAGQNWLVGDPTRINQVITNLIGNAIKFTESGNVELRIRILAKDKEKTKLRLEVQDDGIGIEPEAISKIFQPFTQSDSSTTRQFGGTGLGLSICESLVKAMGGEIGVESRLKKGSKFWFEISLRNLEPCSLDEQGHVGDTQVAGEIKALIVEDNLNNREIFSKTLSYLGIDSETAASGSKAIELLRANEYDIIFMDLSMENLDGFETTRIIRGLSGKKYKEIPIVAVTANVTPECRKKCDLVGMQGFIPKPMTITNLKECLHRVLPVASL